MAVHVARSLLAAVAAAVAVTALAKPPPASAASTAAINGSATYQRIDGFGASEAFGQAATLMNAPAATQQQALNLLFGTNGGAGLTILRNEIPSDANHTIEPNAPASPTASPAYVPLGNDWGQEWLASTIKSDYGVSNVFADAWGAPAFMKTNDSDTGGGTLCGVPGASCASGDWRQAYANYLVQYAKDYAADGINLSYIGFENEANLAPSYSGMVMSPSQTANFADVMGPALASSGLPTGLECCATEGWDYAAQYASAIEADPAASSAVSLFTSHGYTAAPTSPLPGWSKLAWETEWSTFDGWDPAWDDGSDASGFTWAQHIYQGLTGANLSAFLYWWGSGTPSANGDNESLIQVNGSTVTPSGRLWAFANYSRFVRPGATRIGASTSDSNLDLAAFKNTDGSVAIVALNSATAADPVSFSLANTGTADGTAVTPYRTDSAEEVAPQPAVTVSGSAFSATLPARSLVTFVIPAPAGGGTGGGTTPGTCRVAYTTSSQWPGGFVANVTITNGGSAPVSGWTLTFTFPGDQRITSAWNGAASQAGENVTITNLSYNATIGAGGSTSLGFQGTWNTSDAAPASFAVNGTACTT